jgi:outer membrane protein TolC
LKRLFVALTFLAPGAAAVPAMAQEAAPGPAPQLTMPQVPTPEVPTANELPTGTSDRNLPELTFEQAVMMARKNNRTIKVDRAQLAAAQTATEAAWSALLPVVLAEGRYTRNYAQVQFPFMVMGMTKGLLIQPLNQWDGVISATTPLVAPAAWAGLKSVNASVATAEANFDSEEANLLVSVGESFLAAAGDDELVEARRSNLVVAQHSLPHALEADPDEQTLSREHELPDGAHA